MPANSLELAMELSHASAWMLEDEPDASSWSGPAALEELGDEAEWAELEIPAVPLADSLPTEAWNLDAPLRSPLRRAIAAAAAFVPLMLSAEPVLAAPPAVDQPAAPVEDPPPASSEGSVTVVVTEDPPRTDSSAIWAALTDKHVLLQMRDGTSFRGMVLGVTDDGALVCAREGDGLVVLVKAAEISTAQVEGLPPIPAPPKPANGQGLIVVGSIATAIGGALAIATVAVAGSCATNDYYGYTYLCPYITLPTGIVGAVNLAVGIPLLATGLRKRAAAREATRPAVSGFVLPGRNGAMAGVGVRF